MATTKKTFSESWYRVADQSIMIRPGVKIHRQFFRGEKWYVLQDPFNNQFFRLRPSAYEFVVRLNTKTTVQQIWEECLELFPDTAPGQEEVIQLLAQLYHANLLQYHCPADSLVLFKRFQKRRSQEIKSRAKSFMFPRFTLLDPDVFLKTTLPLVRPLMGWFGWVIWLVVIGLGIKAVVDHADQLLIPGAGILRPDNLGWLYLALVITKVFHEFGHAYVCRHYGGEVHKMGVMLLIFTPIPFVDASSSWAFASRRQRIHVASAGMLIELFVASIAALVWGFTGDGLVHQLCFNMMFIASVSTLLFNLNPLLRFDGYYILSDLLALPNLHTRARNQWRYLFERRFFGIRSARKSARNFGEAVTLYTFGFTSGIYRIFLFSSIILFVADQFLILGLVLAVLLAIAWGLVPLGRLVYYLSTSTALARTRPRAILATAGLVLLVLSPLQFIPLPQYFKAPGVLEAKTYQRVYASSSGFFDALSARSGESVTEGSPLLALTNPDLAFETRATEFRGEELKLSHRIALKERQADIDTVESMQSAVAQQLGDLRAEKEHLVITAPLNGIYHSTATERMNGIWLPKGIELGIVIQPGDFQFIAVVPQAQASRLFDDAISTAEVKIKGIAAQTLQVSTLEMIPFDQEILPSAGLGAPGGGTVNTSNTGNMRVLEPYFRVQAQLTPDAAARLQHGRTGSIRFRLKDEPLLPRWLRAFSQLLQQRYQI